MTFEELMFILSTFCAAFIHHLWQNITVLAIMLIMLSSRRPIVKVHGFYEVTVPNMSYRMFRRYFRMFPPTLNSVINLIRNDPNVYQTPQYTRIKLAKKVAMTCAYLGSAAPTIQLSHLFGISEEAFIRVTHQCIKALVNKMSDVIIWPNENELHLYSNQFDSIGRFFPNVIGAIDDIHLEITLTEEKRYHRSYYCWKQYYSIHLQAVATYDLRFLDVFVGWPGRSHDARVFRNNPLYTTLPDRLRDRAIHRLIETYHIVGDSAFPCSPQVMTPFKRNRDNDLNEVQKKFNTHLSSKRNNQYRALNQRYQPLGTDESSRIGMIKGLQMANMIFLNP